MDKVICPSCKEILNRPKLDQTKSIEETGNIQFSCIACGYTTSAWQFDVVYITEEDEEQDG